MANDGQKIADDLKDTFTFKNARDAVSHAVDTAKHYLGVGDSSPAPQSKPDNSNQDSPIKSANEAFKNAAKSLLPKYKNGTDYVPETGPAILHKGEAVLTKEEADKHRARKSSGHTDTVQLSKHRVVMHLHKGGLHRALHIPEGETIPKEKLNEARNSKNPHVREMANLAHTMEGWHKK